jgi:hypothetical protein
VSFKTYHSKQNEFEQIFEKQFRGDFRKFLEYLKNDLNKYRFRLMD